MIAKLLPFLQFLLGLINNTCPVSNKSSGDRIIMRTKSSADFPKDDRRAPSSTSCINQNRQKNMQKDLQKRL